ncbi:hypothetical protein CSV67_02815 [Sporosarcina sp. P2]|uniref:hypothetical protein n=1 Tax=Sporosarcina sp. P2 TaxID=2048251 RepID=UPI000C166528|nr:hypothetical protein [Sporosarcina sp. P2]PID03591.1 hypothetical protein CSV67_02815 [Sporosarcina sp. P2]
MAEPYVYVPFQWLDQIVEQDELGNVIYEKDPDGKIIYLTDRFGNYILDPITNKPLPKPRLLQVGTKHSAKRENHQEQGIAKSHERLDKHANDILRLQINQELDGKAPGNSGTFVDAFDGEPNKLIRQTAKAVLTVPRSAGTTVLNVDNVDGFIKFTDVTIYDDTNSEDTLITDVTASTITVQPLVNNYVKGAVIARSNAAIKNSRMGRGAWGTYSVEEVV